MSKSNSILVMMKAALFSGVIAFVLMGSLLPFTPENPLNISGQASRTILTYFAVTALGVMLFPRLKLATLAVSLGALAALVELVQFAPVFGHSPDVLEMISAIAGISIALAPTVIGREFPMQSKGASPSSLSFLP